LTAAAAIWVGVLELDGIDEVTGVNGAVRADQDQARVLVRLHGAPLGFVTVPVRPLATLTPRVQMAAKAGLADELDRHLALDASADGVAIQDDWTTAVACPRRFAPGRGPAGGHAGISIVICSRDRTRGLADCLAAVQQSGYAPLEILVVDNAPADGQTRDLVGALARDDNRIRYSCEPRPGLSMARNRGLAEASYDLVGFTDDDALADSGWPAALAAGLVADPGTVCVTGFVATGALDTSSERYFDARYSWGEVSEPRRYDLAAHRQPGRLYPFRAGIFGTGANFAVRRDAVLAAGGFDPLLGAGAPGRGGEDLDMFLRLILAGGRISYLPSAFVWHRHRSDRRALGEQTYSYGHGLGAYLAKHLSDRRLRSALARHGLAELGTLAGRMRRATRDSQFGPGGGRLALTEARGVAAGLMSYRRAARVTGCP
jgi:GT2 family glycosyltransferase